MAVKQAALAALASLLLLSLTASTTMATPAFSVAPNKVNTIRSMGGVRAAPGQPVDAAAVYANQAAVNTISRPSVEVDAECHQANVTVCYTKDDKRCCGKARARVCGATCSASTSRMAIERPVEETVDGNQAAISTIFRSSDGANAECHRAYVLACYTKDDKKCCGMAWASVCSAECTSTSNRTAIERPVEATADDNQAAVSTISRSSEDVDYDCHWVRVKACYTKDGKKYCKVVSVKVCGASTN